MQKPSFVDANYRFIAAYQEVNTRISQRQNALAMYVTLVVSLLAALVALKPSDLGTEIPVEWLMLGFPVASLSYAFLNFKAERAITNLRRFLSALEQLENAHEFLPSYNTHQHWAADANKARRFHDYASAVLVAGGNLIGLGVVIKIYAHHIPQTSIALWMSILISLAAVLTILFSPYWSFTPNQALEKSNKA